MSILPICDSCRTKPLGHGEVHVQGEWRTDAHLTGSLKPLQLVELADAQAVCLVSPLALISSGHQLAAERSGVCRG